MFLVVSRSDVHIDFDFVQLFFLCLFLFLFFACPIGRASEIAHAEVARRVRRRKFAQPCFLKWKLAGIDYRLFTSFLLLFILM